MHLEDYIATHFIAQTDMVGRKLTIIDINNLSLKIVVLVLTKIRGPTSLH